jgi:hypothetical protein
MNPGLIGNLEEITVKRGIIVKTVKNKLAVAAIAMLACSAPVVAGGVTVAEQGDNKMKIGMKAFINLTNSKVETNGATTDRSKGFAVDRFYLWVSYQIDDIWSAKIVTDVNNEQGRTGSATTPGLKRNMNVFVKAAFIQAKFNPAAVAWVGLAGTPWIPYEEGLWAHRFVTNTYVDGYGYDDSADFGAGLKGKFAGGMFEYNVAAVNGGGYSKPNKSDAIDVNARLTLRPLAGMDISGGYRRGDRGTKTFGVSGNTSTLTQGLISYGIDRGRVTAGYIRNSKEVGAIKTVNKGFDVYGWVKLTDKFGAFVRYDNEKQTVTANAVEQKLTRYIGGLDYIYNKVVRFSLAFDQQKKSNNGNVSGILAKTTKYGLYSQVNY